MFTLLWVVSYSKQNKRIRIYVKYYEYITLQSNMNTLYFILIQNSSVAHVR